MFTKSARLIELTMAHALKLNVAQMKIPIEVVTDSALSNLYCSYWLEKYFCYNISAR
jgi:hypothetical protein